MTSQRRSAVTADEALETFNYLDPLTGDDPRWVDLGAARGDQPVARLLARAIRASRKQPYHALVLGHRGTGKTTELRRLMDDLGRQGHLALSYDATERVDTEDVALPDLLLLLVRAVLELAEARQLALPTEPLQLLDAWLGWVRAQLGEARAAEAGPSVTATLPEVRSLGERLLLDPTARETLRRAMEKSTGDLLNALDQVSGALVAAARRAGHAGVVIALDGLDLMRYDRGDGGRPSSYEALFVYNAPQLQRLRTHLVLVAPIGLAVQGRADQHWQVFTLPNVMVTRRSGEPNEPAIEALLSLVAHRADLEALFEGGRDTARRAIELSGGNVRDLLRVLYEAALRSAGPRISRSDVEHYALAFGSDLWARTRDDNERSHLRLPSPSYDVTGDPLVQRMLQLGIFLSYRNSEHWAALHPCVRLLVQRRVEGERR